LKEGLRGSQAVERYAEFLANPSAELVVKASEQAEYRLFRQPAGKITNAILNAREVIPGLKYVLPFVRTPVNILKFGAERSPLGFANPRLYKNLKAGSAEASDQIARATIGSLVAVGVAYYFANGKITAGVPTNPSERDRFYREGKLPYAVKLGGKWVQYQRMEPFNQPFSQVAGVVDAVNNKDKNVQEQVLQAAFNIGQNLTNQTYMSGLSDMLDALSQPERELPGLISRQVTGMVPFSSALRTTAQQLDPTVRQPENIVESVQAGLPVVSKKVPARLTAFGEEAQRQSPAWSPIQVSTSRDNPVDAELGRLGFNIGFVGTTIDNKKLTREQQDEYQREAGAAVRLALDELVRRADYRRKNDAGKEKAIEKARDDARDLVRSRLKRKWGNELGRLQVKQPTAPAPATPTPGAPARTPPMQGLPPGISPDSDLGRALQGLGAIPSTPVSLYEGVPAGSPLERRLQEMGVR